MWWNGPTIRSTSWTSTSTEMTKRIVSACRVTQTTFQQSTGSPSNVRRGVEEGRRPLASRLALLHDLWADSHGLRFRRLLPRINKNEVHLESIKSMHVCIMIQGPMSTWKTHTPSPILGKNCKLHWGRALWNGTQGGCCQVLCTVFLWSLFLLT